jgi:hypothetical protein
VTIDLLQSIGASIGAGGAAGALVAWLVQQLLGERLRAAVQHEYAAKLETYKAQVQADMAEKIDRVRGELGELGELERRNRERWNIKREACLTALSVVDKVFTNISWEDRTNPSLELKIARSRVDPSEVRDTMNLLILACEDPTVVHLFLKCIGLQESGEPAMSIDPSEVQHLRNAIRRELGFGTELELNPNLSWILAIHGDGVIETERNQNAPAQQAFAAEAAPATRP